MTRRYNNYKAPVTYKEISLPKGWNVDYTLFPIVTYYKQFQINYVQYEAEICLDHTATTTVFTNLSILKGKKERTPIWQERTMLLEDEHILLHVERLTSQIEKYREGTYNTVDEINEWKQLLRNGKN